MTKRQIIELILSGGLALVVVSIFFNQKRVFQDLALGTETTRVLGTDSLGKPIHVVEMDGQEEQMKSEWEENGKLPVIFLLGNSQSHSVNQYKSGDSTYISLLHRILYPSMNVLCQSIPNASLQEFLVLYNYWKKELPIKVLVLPVFMDDLREDGIRDVFVHRIVERGFRLEDTSSKVNKRIGEELSRIKKASSETNNAEDISALKETVQESVEARLNQWLDTHFFAWSYRPNVRGELFNGLYNFRNTVFGINASTKRKMIPARMNANLEAFSEILEDAFNHQISVVVYIPPIRHDVPLPYDKEEYEKFKGTIAATVEKFHAAYADLDTLVPGIYWGMKASTNSTGKSEIDYMHFQGEGHRRLAKSLAQIIRTQPVQ